MKNQSTDPFGTQPNGTGLVCLQGYMLLGKPLNTTRGWASQCLDSTKARGYVTMKTVEPDPNLIGVYNQTINHGKKPWHSKRATRLLIIGVIALTGVLVTPIYNTVTIKKDNSHSVNSGHWDWPQLQTIRENLTYEAGQTYKPSTKIYWLTGQYGPR